MTDSNVIRFPGSSPWAKYERDCPQHGVWWTDSSPDGCPGCLPDDHPNSYLSIAARIADQYNPDD